MQARLRQCQGSRPCGVSAWLLVVAIAATLPVRAEVTATVGLFSDYVFRAVSQTREGIAAQASLDWAGQAGWYAGTWASNVDFGSDANIEVDYYGGYGAAFGGKVNYDLQLVYYTYPGSDDENDYPELLLSANYDAIKFLAGYTWDNYGSGERTVYFEARFETKLGKGYRGHGALGRYDFDHADRQFFPTAPNHYTNWSIGISKTWREFAMNLDYYDTNQDGEALYGKDVAESRVVFSISRTFILKE